MRQRLTVVTVSLFAIWRLPFFGLFGIMNQKEGFHEISH